MFAILIIRVPRTTVIVLLYRYAYTYLLIRGSNSNTRHCPTVEEFCEVLPTIISLPPYEQLGKHLIFVHTKRLLNIGSSTIPKLQDSTAKAISFPASSSCPETIGRRYHTCGHQIP